MKFIKTYLVCCCRDFALAEKAIMVDEEYLIKHACYITIDDALLRY